MPQTATLIALQLPLLASDLANPLVAVVEAAPALPGGRERLRLAAALTDWSAPIPATATDLPGGVRRGRPVSRLTRSRAP